jgi:hemoglobin-like flavoprotein
MDEGLREALTVARASFERCDKVPGFFEAFYTRLFEIRPDARVHFAKTEFARQHRLLRHAIGLLLSFPAERDGEPNILSRLAERHSRRDLAIEPSFYPPFLESLIDTLRRHDPSFTPEIEQAWRTTLAKGFAYMQSRY